MFLLVCRVKGASLSLNCSSNAASLIQKLQALLPQLPRVHSSCPAERIKGFAEIYAGVLDPDFIHAATEKRQNFETWMKGPAYKLCLWLQPDLIPND
jgi:hypothetical protein